MKKYGKKYNEVKKNIPTDKQNLSDALNICKENAPANFDESVDVVFSLGIDTKAAEENIRTTVSLPHGNGKTIKIAVFAGGEALTEAEKAGADIVGGKELATKVASEEKLDVDLVISTPEMMAEVGQLGKILGPQGLMPNPKTGTVTMDIAKAVTEIKGGKIDFKVDKTGIIHASVGKVSFTADKIKDNANELINTIVKLKPSGAKGVYIKSISMSSTMSPGIAIESKFE